MEALSETANYWLVNHPTISNFEWEKGVTFGASPLFLIQSSISYLLMIFLILYYQSYFRSLSIPLRLITPIYNLAIFTLSLLMAVGCGLSILSQMPVPHGILCFPATHTPTRGPIFFWGYIFYLSKILEFADTLFILLSKSSIRRLSFLHVFHHSLVLIMSFIWINTPQPLFPLGVVTNATVHTVMYSYYMMCSLGIRPTWKRMVTNIQIFQFVFGFSVVGVSMYRHLVKYRCPGWGGAIYAWSFDVLFNAFLLYLFVNFYSTSYNNKKKTT